MKKIFFRVDGASFIGYGHLYRTFVLAKEFKKNGYEVSAGHKTKSRKGNTKAKS